MSEFNRPKSVTDVLNKSLNRTLGTISTSDFVLMVQMGLIPGASFLDKFGAVDEVTTTTDPADVWEGASTGVVGNQIYPFSPTLKSGAIISGKIYTTYEYVSGDDFSNVADIGAAANVTGAVWTATGTTPTTWTNESILNTTDIGEVSSTNAADTQIIEFKGLLGDGTSKTGYAKLSGTTTVNIFSNPDGLTGDQINYWRIFRAENLADAGGDLAGVLYVYVNGAAVGGATAGEPDNDVDVKLVINDGNNQTLMSIITIEKGKVGFLFRGEGGISRGGGVSAEAILSYRSRRFGKVFKVKKRIAAVSQGSSNYQDVRSAPDIVPALTDIVLRVDEVSASLGLWGTLDLLLLDESLLKPEFLTLIGQPQ